MRWIIFVCLIGCGAMHDHGVGGDDDDDGSGSGSGSGSNAGVNDSCGGLSRPWLATGEAPTGIVSGDFDRDGLIDLAVNSGTITHAVGTDECCRSRACWSCARRRP